MGGIVCESSAIDSITQNFSAFKIIDQITADVRSTDPTKTARSLEKIVMPMAFQVISLWKRNKQSDFGKPIEQKVMMEILDPNQKVLAKNPFQVILPLDKIRSRAIINVQGMPVSETGEYCLQMKEATDTGEEILLAKLCFDIIVNKN